MMPMFLAAREPHQGAKESPDAMKKWLYDRPWIWIVVFLSVVVAASVALIIIAHINRPTVLPH